MNQNDGLFINKELQETKKVDDKERENNLEETENNSEEKEYNSQEKENKSEEKENSSEEKETNPQERENNTEETENNTEEKGNNAERKRIRSSIKFGRQPYTISSINIYRANIKKSAQHTNFSWTNFLDHQPHHSSQLGMMKEKWIMLS